MNKKYEVTILRDTKTIVEAVSDIDAYIKVNNMIEEKDFNWNKPFVHHVEEIKGENNG